MAVRNETLVNAYYWGVLGRAPDADGFRFWVGKMNEGLSGEDVVSLFLNGAERQQSHPDVDTASAFIDSCYQDLLGRAADAGGKHFWLGRLEQLTASHEDARAAVIVEMVDYLAQPQGQGADQHFFQARLDPWHPVVPGLALREDTGHSATDGITSNGQVDVTLPKDVQAWSYSLDGGTTWTDAAPGATGLQLTEHLFQTRYDAGSVQVSYLDTTGATQVIANKTDWTVDTHGTALYLTTYGPKTENLLGFHYFSDGDIQDWRYTTDGGQNWQNGEAGGPIVKVSEGFYAKGAIQVETTDAAGNVAISTYGQDLNVWAADLTPPTFLSVDQHAYGNPWADNAIKLNFDSAVQLGTRNLYMEEYPSVITVDPAKITQAYLLDITTGEQIDFASAMVWRQQNNSVDIVLKENLQEGHQYSVYLPDAFVYDTYNNAMPELTLVGTHNTFVAA